MKVIRKLLQAAQVYPANIRYDETGDTVQYTPDGGTTWIDSPENDPRQHNHYPPLETDDPRCDAAARMAALIQELQQQLEDGLQAAAFGAEVTTLILLTLAFIPLIGVLTAVIIGLYSQLVVLGYAAVHAAFDGFDWDEFTCKILAQLPTGGVMSSSGFDALQADITASYTANQQTVLLGILSFLGYGGLNDAASTRGETGDCSSCPASFDIYIPMDFLYYNSTPDLPPGCGCGAGEWGEYLGGSIGSYAGNPCWVSQDSLYDNGQRVARHWTINFPAEVTVSQVLVYWGILVGSGNTDQLTKRFKIDGVSYYCANAFPLNPTGISTASYSDESHEFYMGIGTCIGNDSRRYMVYAVRVIGTGTPPQGWLTEYL